MFKSKLAAMALVLLTCGTAVSQDYWLRSLAPHQIEKGRQFVEVLRQESLEDSISKLFLPDEFYVDYNENLGLTAQKPQFDVHNVLGNRRCVKVIAELANKDQGFLDAQINEVLLEHRRELRSAKGLKYIIQCKYGRHAISTLLIAIAEHAPANTLIRCFEKIKNEHLALASYLSKDRKKHVTLEACSKAFPDPRLQLNAILWACNNQQIAMPSKLTHDLTMQLMPVANWDLGYTIFDSTDFRLFRTAKEYPAYVEIGNAWREVKVFDWPADWEKEKQGDHIYSMVEHLKSLN